MFKSQPIFNTIFISDSNFFLFFSIFIWKKVEENAASVDRSIHHLIT